MGSPFTQPLSHPHAGYPAEFVAGPRFAWTVTAVGDLSRVPEPARGRLIPATVPGCIHTDLMDAGLIPDPAIGMSERDVQWVSWTDWRYELAFEADPGLFEHQEIDLVFECLDTIARVELNGHLVGEAQSEFIPHRFGVLGYLKPGENRLAVTFTSPLRYIHEQARKHGPLPVNGDWDPFCYIRKCASNFQWDWGPEVATCGISEVVRLHAWSTCRFDGLRIYNHSLRFASADLRLLAAQGGARPNGLVLQTSMTTHDGQVVAQSETLIDAERDDLLSKWLSLPTKLWKPARHGDPHRTAVTFRLLWCGEELDRVTQYLGARFSCANYWGDEHAGGPGSFRLYLDEEAVTCLGANWIPEGLWPRDRTYARVRRRLEQARAAGMNMIRVWGGGRYEPDWFYDLCDDLGLMVWQDFMFACACYPEHPEYRALVETEARYQVARLSRHPSVVLWCGGNECEWAYESWGFKENLAETGQAPRGWGQYYYRDLLPKIVAELSPGTPYIPNSPFSPTPGRHPNDAAEGDRHTWDLIGDEFRSHLPRFCSEFGIQSPSCRETLAEAGLLAGPVEPGTVVPAALVARQRGPGGMQRWYDEPLARLFPAATGFDEWLEQAHEMQARHLYTAIVWLRANPEVCSGALIWQLNDAWPGLSWSLIDSAGREKPAYEAVKRAFAPRLIEVFPIEGRDHLVIINGTDEAWAGRHEVGGRSVPFDVGPRSAARISLV